jgi:hypothetical protein
MTTVTRPTFDWMVSASVRNAELDLHNVHYHATRKNTRTHFVGAAPVAVPVLLASAHLYIISLPTLVFEVNTSDVLCASEEVMLSTTLETTDDPADAATLTAADVARLTAAEVAELTNPPPTLPVAEVAALAAAEVAAPAAEVAADPANTHQALIGRTPGTYASERTV